MKFSWDTITKIVALVVAIVGVVFKSDLSTVPYIIAVTLLVTQLLKTTGWFDFLPVKILSGIVGVAVTLVSYFVTHSITGDLWTIIVQVVLGIVMGVAASVTFDTISGQERNRTK